ncbi:MAG: hypothetical protein GVY29_12755 [Spirochaetes bacterium]|jgi:hypothetical protein|nr:hypothetical protein [Spirochaetota bacterium]
MSVLRTAGTAVTGHTYTGLRLGALLLAAVLVFAGCSLLGGSDDNQASEGTQDDPVDLGTVEISGSTSHEASLPSSSSIGYYKVGVTEDQEYAVTVTGYTEDAGVEVFSDAAFDQRLVAANSDGSSEVTVTVATTGLSTVYIEASTTKIGDDFTLEVTHTGSASSS